MVEDLKRQASELYREQSENGKIPTSDSLSMKKIVYISIAAVAALLLVVQLSGGFKSNTDAVTAANTPPPLEKEAPPPELLEPEPPAPAPEPAPPAASVVEAPRPMPEPPPPAKEKPAVKPAPAPREAKPALVREPPAPPPAPEISDEEQARRELARDLVVRKNAGLAQLVIRPGNQGWRAVPEGGDSYQVAFSIRDESGGQTAEYIWRVNLATASITPLSYHARRLP